MENAYTISTDKSRLNRTLIHRFLSQDSYWAQNIPMDIVERAIQGALCFGVYHGEEQVGYARVITDEATFAYLSDVFIVAEHRGKGLSKYLMETISGWPTLQGLRRWVLATRDAHTLYAQFGFTELDHPEWFMQRKLIEKY
ncbi:GNAT family N-acetyltransferase [Arsenicibacter rosenii]|uniref:GNAT family N-acetyltransferase n=1 Tax=Arsenicibacter rosenii TaxID=1750698 RepID=A0A1S2VEN8_9BACT|nr:GNAT family N-acetyltransferase [Arsenicibacter rosenii]OIN57221.1 GNAT family N-acetyltransferase [Arsenicibacter rosenii]